MGTTLPDMLAKFKRLNLRNEVKRQVQQDYSGELIALNQRQLFAQSVDSNNIPLRFYNSNFYAFEKEKRNPLPGFGRPDLYDTGAFYRAFVVRVNSNFYTIASTDKKTNLLTEKYGKDIFGLTEESKKEFVEGSLYTGIKRYVESITGLTLR